MYILTYKGRYNNKHISISMLHIVLRYVYKLHPYCE